MFFLSDKESRPKVFSRLLEELVETKSLPKARRSRCPPIMYIVRLSRYLTAEEDLDLDLDLDMQIDTYIHWFNCKLHGKELEYTPRYLSILMHKLDAIESANVDPQVKEYYGLFNIALDGHHCLRLKDEIYNILSREKTGAQYINYEDTRLDVRTFFTMERFFAGLPTYFPRWILNVTFNDDEIINSWDD